MPAMQAAYVGAGDERLADWAAAEGLRQRREKPDSSTQMNGAIATAAQSGRLSRPTKNQQTAGGPRPSRRAVAC